MQLSVCVWAHSNATASLGETFGGKCIAFCTFPPTGTDHSKSGYIRSARTARFRTGPSHCSKAHAQNLALLWELSTLSWWHSHTFQMWLEARTLCPGIISQYCPVLLWVFAFKDSVVLMPIERSSNSVLLFFHMWLKSWIQLGSFFYNTASPKLRLLDGDLLSMILVLGTLIPHFDLLTQGLNIAGVTQHLILALQLEAMGTMYLLSKKAGPCWPCSFCSALEASVVC